MTIYEKIKSMSIEEMADYLQGMDFGICPEDHIGCKQNVSCKKCTELWLESEWKE